ncbi:MAG: protein translocase subunit SecD, partial [Halioglobus sp.]|nr:protein translocase subunit SecD [Halioglobus sp.]
MLNKYPLWKYLLVLFFVALGLFYAAPNLYTPDPALQITGESSAQQIDQQTLGRALAALDEAGIEHFDPAVDASGRNALIRLRDKDQQLPAQARVSRAIGDGYIVALNLAPTTPDWLSDYGARPMKLGLDLSGGVHFMLEVDVDSAIERRMEYFTNAIKRTLREERIRGFVSLTNDGTIEAKFKTEALREQARDAIADAESQLSLERVDAGDSWNLVASLPESARKEIAEYSVAQNLTTLRNRVNELGVSEPLVQRQGQNRIVVELPGIQDTAEAKRILGKVANLEFRLVANMDAPPSEKQRFEYRSPDRASASEWLERDVIITGERVSNAKASFDQNGMPNVQISLDSEGGSLLSRATRNNVTRRMGVLFIERKYRTRYEVQ